MALQNSHNLAGEIMDYITRHFEKVIDYALKQTKVVLITGPRQVGKTKILLERYSNFNYVTLDDDNALFLANDDRKMFFKKYKTPLAIDEVQYAQELFRTIKLIVDKSDKKGQIILTGSQSFLLMDKITDSLSGRISILELSTLSIREINKISYNKPFIPNDEYINDRKNEKQIDIDIWENIYRGSFPEMQNRNLEWFYRDYINTYLERDVKKIINIKDELIFRKFLICIAARTGQLLVYEDIADDLGIAVNTVKSWVSLVVQTGIIRIINTYQNNILKRIIKTPKIYFMDTGLVCYLGGWKTKEQCENGAMSGYLFETFVVSEICKSFLNAGKSLDSIYYYRDKEKNEIDLIIEDGNDIYPVEIKRAATISNDWKKYNKIISKIKNKNVKPISVICNVDEYISLSDNVNVIPYTFI